MKKFQKLVDVIDRSELYSKVYESAFFHHYELKQNVIPLYEFGKNDGGIYREEPYEKRKSLLFAFEKYKNARMSDEEFEKAFTGKRSFDKVTFNLPTGFAIITGSVSNVLALDIDDYKKEFVLPQKLTSPLIDKTPNGGKHSYFQYDKSVESLVSSSKRAKTFLKIGDFEIEVLINQLVLVSPSMVLSKDGTFIGEYEYLVGDRNTFKNLPVLKADDLKEHLKKREMVSVKKADKEWKIYTTDVIKDPNLLIPYLNDWYPEKLNLPASTVDRHLILLSLANSLFKYGFGFEMALSAVKYAYSTFERHDPEYSDEEMERWVTDAQKNVGSNVHQFSSSSKIPIPQHDVNYSMFKVDSGYELIDKKVHGFRSANTYLVGGYEKSGKSSFLAKMALSIMNGGNRIGMLHTELTTDEINTMFAAIKRNQDKYDVEEDDFGKRWREEIGDLFLCKSQTDLTASGELSFDLMIQAASEFVKEGCKIMIFDNLTTFYNLAQKAQNWQVLGECIQKIVSFSKLNNVISFFVVHQKPEAVYTETPQNVKNFIKEHHPERIFDESKTTIYKPTGSMIYGGGGARSQLSGSILIWRPYQQYDEYEDVSQLSAVLLESFRHSPSGMVRMKFDGAKGIFTELADAEKQKEDWEERD